jgi:hypothetical protein
MPDPNTIAGAWTGLLRTLAIIAAIIYGLPLLYAIFTAPRAGRLMDTKEILTDAEDLATCQAILAASQDHTRNGGAA